MHFASTMTLVQGVQESYDPQFYLTFLSKKFPKNTIRTFLPLLIGSIVAIRNVQKTVLGHFYPFLLGQSASRSEKLSEVGSDLFLT